MRKYLSRLLAAGLLAVVSTFAFADSGTLVTLTGTPAVAPMVLCSAQPAVNTATACTSPVPGSNQRVYVTAVYFDVCTNGTGTAQNNVNYTLTGAAGFVTATNFATYSMAATPSICQHWGYVGQNGIPLFAGQPGVAVVVTPPTAATNNSTASTMFGYIGS